MVIIFHYEQNLKQEKKCKSDDLNEKQGTLILPTGYHLILEGGQDPGS